MEVRELLNVLHIAERLKDELRHCETSKGRRESVAEHSWRLALMAFFMKDEFPTLNMDKVIKMCLIHDLGECFTGDIPTFMKSASDEKKEDTALFDWVASLPLPYDTELAALRSSRLTSRSRISAQLPPTTPGPRMASFFMTDLLMLRWPCGRSQGSSRSPARGTCRSCVFFRSCTGWKGLQAPPRPACRRRVRPGTRACR